LCNVVDHTTPSTRTPTPTITDRRLTLRPATFSQPDITTQKYGNVNAAINTNQYPGENVHTYLVMTNHAHIPVMTLHFTKLTLTTFSVAQNNKPLDIINKSYWKPRKWG